MNIVRDFYLSFNGCYDWALSVILLHVSYNVTVVHLLNFEFLLHFKPAYSFKIFSISYV